MPIFTRRLLLAFVLLAARSGWAQIPKQKHIELIKSRSESWNKSFNARDTAAFYGLFAPDAVVTAASGPQVGLADNARSFRALFRQRPDVNWMNKTSLVEMNDQAMVAYETGEWTESWSNKPGSDKARVIGKYALMWKYAPTGWVVSAAIFTPLFCSGGSCK